ncbi:DUF4272 domain-containing protein [Coraliomargarita akajimensis]|uniref:DUF4272 domain-containing protein n=1 Tax=Coraliomargarita akajimensis (strain DSM 45221 / IAM 15411 / JCM 23193 / KCTC 12865 / 04OKA010-24) TaxID=583355 RepID=D5EMD4_CORAD|nr:DUF4272 domain-containing protein [Coraliomargarita akajimensis]ADE53340.1 hypothetical protein Caka_0315 [Coraliomargarita akajimensis DSM 45221]
MEESEDIEISIRSSHEIAGRVLALVAVVAKSQKQNWVRDWVERNEITNLLSAAEKDFLADENPEQQQVVNFSWRAEALVSLVWSLGGISEMPALSEQHWLLENEFITAAMNDPKSFIAKSERRPDNELENMEGFLYHQHWRVRDNQLGLNVGAKMPLEEGELPIEELNSSVVYERRYGLSWIVGCGEDWDEVPTDT